MLVAEEVAKASGKNLDFGDWDGIDDAKICDDETDNQEANESVTEPPLSDEEAKPVSKSLNQDGYHSDDSLSGYVSEPSSSRSPSPAPSELDEIEKDPTLRVTEKKIPRPVYLAQLGEMLRPTTVKKGEDEELQAQTQEVALNTVEELIKRRGAMVPSSKNAINLAYGRIGLQNDYDIHNSSKKRQNALNALVACCPRKASPAIVDEFFKNQYSTDQRYTMLNAIALGANKLLIMSDTMILIVQMDVFP